MQDRYREGRAWCSFLSYLGIVADTATLHGPRQEVICYVRPRRFGSSGTIFMHGAVNVVRYKWLSESWKVRFRSTGTLAVAQRSDNDILVGIENSRGVHLYRMRAIFQSRTSPFIVREVRDMSNTFLDDARNPICVEFGGDSWFSRLSRSMDADTYAFLFFLYVIVVRRRRRTCCVGYNL